MEYELIGGVALAPIILALIQLAKRTFPNFDTDLFGAALAVVIAVVIAVGYAANEGQNLINALAVGVMIGLSASGLYSGTHAAQRVRKAETLIDPEATRDG